MTSLPQAEIVGRGAAAGAGRCACRRTTTTPSRRCSAASSSTARRCRSCATCSCPRTSTPSATRSSIAPRSRSTTAARRSTRSRCATSSSAVPGSAAPAGMDYIAELTLVVPSAASVKHYADIVIAHALRRRLIEAGGEVSRLGFDNTTPVHGGDRPGRAEGLQDRPGEPRLGDAQHRAGGARVVGHRSRSASSTSSWSPACRPTSRSSTRSPRACSPAS